jgi:hypothetical protein
MLTANAGGFYMKYFSLVLGVLLLAGFAHAADIDGTWTGSITEPKMDISFKFKAEGKTLTGFHIIQGTETAIKDGKIDGDKISFSVTINMGAETKFEHKGVVTGDQIKMTYDDGAGQKGEIIVKKDKEKAK